MAQNLVSVLYDTNFDKILKLYNLITAIDLKNDAKIMDDTIYNFLIWGAAHAVDQRQFLL